MLIHVLIIIALNLVFFWRTLFFRYSVDDWENARCACKEPKFVATKMTRHGKPVDVEICEKCHILKPIKPKNFMEKFLLSVGGLFWIKDSEGNNITTTQYADPVFDHSITLGLHIINCVLVFFAFGYNEVSLLTALLFSIHPTAMQGSSVWLSGTGYSLGLTFCLLAYWLAPAAPLFYAIGSWYVSVLVLPLVFIKTKFWFWVLLLPVVFLLRRKNLKDAIGYKYKMVKITREPFHWHNILLVFKTIGYYLCQCIFPVNLGVHHSYLQMHGVTEEDTKLTLSLKDRFFWIGVFASILMAYLFFFNWSPAAFGLFWFFVFIAPWSNWMAAVNQPIAERYCIIALVGALYALANVIIPYREVCVGFFVYYITITNKFLPAYENILEFAVYNVFNFPRSFQGWLWKSDIERNFRLFERSFDSAMQAWLLRPNEFLVNNNIATMMLMQHKYNEAEEFIKRMEKAEMPTEEMKIKRDNKVALMRTQIKNDMEAIQERMRQGRNEPCKCGSGKKFKHCHGE